MFKKSFSTEIGRTNPDFIVHVPKNIEKGDDCGNEHFLVFDMKYGTLGAVWTQSSFEGRADQRIVFSRSFNGGITWQTARTIAGGKSDPKTGSGMCSWGFPILTASGRIYVFYNKHIGVNDIFCHTTGLMGCIYSVDNGVSWSEETIIPMPHDKWDNPDDKVPANWIVWQRPLDLGDGRHLAGFTHWVSPKVRPPAPLKAWWSEEAVIQFMRFENINDDPEPRNLSISRLASGDAALRAPILGYPHVSCAQEPSLVHLPDGGIFCSMRTATGSPCFSVSRDRGETWTKPEILRYKDGGVPLMHPVSPCPIYQIGTGEYVLTFHNHDGHFGKWGPAETTFHRRPIWFARGEFRKDAKQPVWFSDPLLLMDNDGIPLNNIDGSPGRTDLAMYASLTISSGEPILWYPERKFFLLGKKIWRERLEIMEVDKK
ncbi:MAG: hypothetical protein A2X45_17960 [Lentisphaerae bacterium GWF2_50_93]|nr:MAG: hypothetical protein A2X45_17960 [Lentisphaerae bacterium GWF2_50_93]